MGSRIRLLLPQGYEHASSQGAARGHGLRELARSVGTGHVPRSVNTFGEKRVVEIYGDVREKAVVIVTRPSGIMRRPPWADWVTEERVGTADEAECTSDNKARREAPENHEP